MDDTKHDLVAILRTYTVDKSIGATFPMDVDLAVLGLDSLSSVNLLLDLEGAFNVSFPDHMLTEETFRTASTLHRALESLLDV